MTNTSGTMADPQAGSDTAPLRAKSGWIIALGVVIFVLVAGYSVAWFWAAGQATAYVKTLETADGNSMPRVVCGDFGIRGFPFGFDATCSNATITSGDVTVNRFADRL